MSIFDENSNKKIAAVLIVSIVLLDVLFANIIKYYNKYNLGRNNHENEYRIKSKLYHHDLRPNTSIPKTVFSNRVYPVYTNSLGFRDDDTHAVPLKNDAVFIAF